jgi:hypothetical protein
MGLVIPQRSSVVVRGQQSSQCQLNARAEHEDPSQLGRPRRQRRDRYLYEVAKSSITRVDRWAGVLDSKENNRI